MSIFYQILKDPGKQKAIIDRIVNIGHHYRCLDNFVNFVELRQWDDMEFSDYFLDMQDEEDYYYTPAEEAAPGFNGLKAHVYAS